MAYNSLILIVNLAAKAIFVGVNKHQDPGIRELSGARPDATALWALFTDTLLGLSARLILDERATHSEAHWVITSGSRWMVADTLIGGNQ